MTRFFLILLLALVAACMAEHSPRSHAADSPATEPRPTAITWKRAVRLIESGQVREVFQLHSRQVTLKTARGETYQTVEPALDEVIRIVRERAPNKDSIPIATE